MSVRSNDIAVVAVATILAGIGVMMAPSSVLRAVAGLPLVFYLPGYAILRATSRGRDDVLASAVFAVGLSLAVTIFCGLALNLSGPLTPLRWTIALGTITLAACIVASARDRYARPAAPAPTTLPLLHPGQAAILACAAAIVVAAAIWVRYESIAHPEFAYTELWMTSDAPGAAVTIGIRNAERAPSSYDLEVTLDGRIVTQRRSIALAVGESWIAELTMPMRDDEAHTAEARLFKDGNDARVYRRAWLKTGSREPQP